MANVQQIALNLVAQLDQGNIQSQASQMASTMARAIEDAFEGLGQRIANTILSGVQSGLRGSIEMVGAVPGSAMTATQRQILSSNVAATGGTLNWQQQVPGMAPGAAPMPPPFMPGPGTQGGFAAPAPGPAGEPIPEPFWTTKRRIAALGAVGAGLGLAGELPGVMRAGRAAEAGVEDFSGRSLMRGDIGSVIANQQVGGDDAMRSRAYREQGMIIAGEFAAAAAGVLGVVFAPITGGLSMLLTAGAIGAAGDATRRAVGFQQGVLGNMQGQTEAEKNRTAEQLQGQLAARDYAMGTFKAAQGMGGREMNEFLFSAARGGQGSLMSQGADLGLGPEQVGAAMQGVGKVGRLFRGPGGAYSSQLEGMNQDISQNILNMQAFGIGSAPEIFSNFARGSAQNAGGLAQSFGAIGDLTSQMEGQNVDKTAMNQFLMGVSQQGSGMGQAGTAQMEASRAISTAGMMFPGQITGDQLGMVARQQQGFMGASRGAGGLQGAIGMQTARQTAEALRRAGLKVDQGDIVNMFRQSGGVISPEEVRLMAQQQGRTISDSDVSRISYGSQQRLLGNEQTNLQRMLPGGLSKVAMAGAAGASNFFEALEAPQSLSMGLRAGGTMGPPSPIGTQVPRGPGAGETVAQARMEAALVVSGVKELGTNLAAINQALKQFLDRLHGHTPPQTSHVNLHNPLSVAQYAVAVGKSVFHK